MRPVPVRASFSRGSASRRRHCFATVPVAKPAKAPVEAPDQK
ncbi:hypothetical protein ACGRL8_00730 [Vibrio rumoiensis]|nr:hypothetical protein [Vibrio rumoiensis]